MTLGETIKGKREALGKSQQELAEMLFVSRQTVSRWENGSRCPDLIMAKKLAMVLGISLDEMVSGEALVGYEAPKEPEGDISCVKVMLVGIMLELVAIFLETVEPHGYMDFTAFCFIFGIIFFAIGLCIPWNKKGKPVISDELPKKKCPSCGKEHDFDYPKCPYCGHDYQKR